MIKLQLISPLNINGHIPQTSTVIFMTTDDDEKVVPIVSDDSDFSFRWKGVPDKYGHMNFHSISVNSYIDAAGTENFTIKRLG